MSLDRRFFENVPKIQLHVHLDGALPVDDIWEIREELGIELPGISEQTFEALERYYHIDPDERYDTREKFRVFLQKFGPTIALTKTPKGMRKAAKAHVIDLARQKHVYAETRFAPQYSVSEGYSLQDVIENALLGLHDGYIETGTLVKLIVSIGRECDRETSLAVAEAATEFQDNGVVALDLACSEEEFPPELHVDAYRLATARRLKRTVHAGEFPKKRSIRVGNMLTALTDLKANGLGHAIPLAREAGIIERVIRDNVRIESCPLSNIMTGAITDIQQLGLNKLLRRGVKVSLSTDDPLMFGTSMADVLEATCDAYAFGLKEVRTLTRNAVDTAFCSAEERDKLYAEFARRGLHLLETN